MKFFRSAGTHACRVETRLDPSSHALKACAAILILTTLAVHGDVPEWLRFQEGNTSAERALFRPMNLPGGPVTHRRVPREAKQELTTQLNASPQQSDLYALRARENELLLDFAAAESDWKKHVETASDKFDANIELANYYHRQLKVPEELQALQTAAALPSPASEKFTPAPEQRSWKLFLRMVDLGRVHLLSSASMEPVNRQWRQRYPTERLPIERAIQLAITDKQYPQAETLLAEFQKQFPGDAAYPINVRARIERERGGIDQAIKVYDQAFDPLWTADLVDPYLGLLAEARAQTRFLNTARAAQNANPLAIKPVASIFHYYRRANPAMADRTLDEYRRRKEARPGQWTVAELKVMAFLWEQQSANPNEAARYLYALYSHASSSPADKEDALARIVTLLLRHPDRKLAIGNGDLSFYRDIATSDQNPGLWNGILSLLLNASEPAYKYQSLEQNAGPYFARAKAAELLTRFEQVYPQSTRRAPMRADLIDAYAAYNETDAVIAAARQFLTSFADHPARVRVSLQLADGHARKNQVKEEVAVYDALLAELATKAEGVPLGEGTIPTENRVKGPRSPEYARVLDRYMSRLVSLKRQKEALAVLRRELDRNPDDPGLYERLAAFLDQNKLAAEIEAVYKRATDRFQERSWDHKLARFYLRQKQTAAFTALTTDITKTFSGSELDQYFRQVVSSSATDLVLYRQVNLAAHQRFPQNLTFVNNLLTVYRSTRTADPVAWENLIRRYWYYDNSLRAQYFQFLSQTGKLRTELAALTPAVQQNNPAAMRMAAEAQVWRSHYEEAYTPFASLAREMPGEDEVVLRASSLTRSLAANDARRFNDAEALLTSLNKADPRDTAVLTQIGEIRMDRAPKSGNAIFKRVAAIEPGNPEGYLEAATLLWDYFEYDEALAMIQEGRRRMTSPAMHAYEAGAIYENKRQYARAIEEYVRGSLAQPGGSPAQSRLMQLARRPALRGSIDAVTAKLVSGNDPPMDALTLRIALLEAQQRKQDLESTLAPVAVRASSFDLLTYVAGEGRRLQLPQVEERALLRQIELTEDPIDKLRLRLDLVRAYESRNDLASAARTIDAVYRENPTIFGVVRSAVNYHWRTKNTARTLELLGRTIQAAHPSRKPVFTFEAARKATEAGQVTAARGYLNTLLAEQPFDSGYIAAMADTYAREKDDRGLRDFYQQKITAMVAAKQPPDSLRRSVIPVLIRARDFGAATQQYIELLTRFPEDASLADEAATFARRNNQQQPLLGHFDKWATASPRDFRPLLILGRLNTNFEDYPNAIASFTKATTVRPDRVDLLIARGQLEERLLRFDEAAVTFEKVYELTYRNAQWMERVALVRARQGRTDDVVASLRKAFLEATPTSVEGYFNVASRLEQWGMLQQAKQFADRGAELAGANFITDYGEGLQVYARVHAKLRQYEAAYAKAKSPLMLSAMAPIVKEYSAAEKTAFMTFLDKQPGADPLSAAREAGLATWEAKRLHQLMMASPGGDESQQYMERLRTLQWNRLAFAEYGAQMEAYSKVFPNNDVKGSLLDSAADAYRKAGDEVAELRVRTQRGVLEDRYLYLLAMRNPQRLLPLIAKGPRDQAAQAAINSGKADLALQAVAARAQGMPPVWNRSYTALAGLYFGLKTPNIDTAFREALGSMVIGDRVGRPTDRTQQLAGSEWYYYGTRYGEYHWLMGSNAADDYLPAQVESMPGSATAYFTLATYYREAGKHAEAIRDYQHGLQLNEGSIAIYDGIALSLQAQGKREEAVANWRQALANFSARLGSGAELAEIFKHIGDSQAWPALREDGATAIKQWVKVQGSFQMESILREYSRALNGPAALATFVASLSTETRQPGGFLQAMLQMKVVPEANAEPIFMAYRDALRNQVATAVGDMRADAMEQHNQFQYRWITFLLDRNQVDRARTETSSLSRPSAELDVRLAVQSGQVEQVIAQMRAGNDEWTATARNVATQLRQRGQLAPARQLMRAHYEVILERGDRTAPSFLGLAEAYLEEGSTAEAIAVLRRMTLVTEPAFANIAESAELLRRFKAGSQAQFLDPLAKAVPWDKKAQQAVADALNNVPVTSPVSKPPRALAAVESDVRNEPDDAVLKLELFRAARTAGRHVLAVNSMEPMLRQYGMLFQIQDMEGDYIPDEPQFYSLPVTTDAERARLLRDLSDSLARTSRPGAALVARRMAADLAAAADDAATINRLTAEAKRRLENERRKPVITSNLTQPNAVRPRIGGAQ